MDDVDAIGAYIARDSPARASLFIQKLYEATGKLELFPECGRVIPEIRRTDCRELLVGPYRIMYRIDGDRVRITEVVHGARNWSPNE